MSRTSRAPLTAAILCLFLSCAVGDALAFQGASYQPASDGPVQLSAEEYNALLDRLERLEARDAKWRPQPAVSRTQFAPALQDPPPPGNEMQENEQREDYGAETGPESAMTQLRLRLEALQGSLNKKAFPTVEIHGAVQVDNGVFGQDANNIRSLKTVTNPRGLMENGSDFRRVRLSANGALTENMNYFVQMDFAFPGRPTFTDVWGELTKLPLIGTIRAGQWKQPFSLEVVSSFRYTTFAERSVLFQAFDPFRHIGIGFFNNSEDEMMTWAASAYRAGQDQFGDALNYGNTGDYAGVARMTRLLWYENEGRSYLHVGGGYNYVAPQALVGTDIRTASFATIPEYFIGQNTTSAILGTAGISQPQPSIDGTPKFVNTRNFPVNHYNLEGVELLFVEGPFSVQSEGMFLQATRRNGVGANFAGFYTTVGYFLTGEHRPYIRKSGAIDRIKPFHNFIKSIGDDGEEECGLGAWEVATRFSYIDLDSRDIRGGRLFDFTAGVNWYLNAFAKVQFNYIRANLTNPTFGDSLANIYGLRAQFDF